MIEQLIQPEFFDFAQSAETINELNENKLTPYWREQLSAWPKAVFMYRHHRCTTGWSMATGGFTFAELLWSYRQITIDEFEKYKRFEERVKKWNNSPSEQWPNSLLLPAIGSVWRDVSEGEIWRVTIVRNKRIDLHRADGRRCQSNKEGLTMSISLLIQDFAREFTMINNDLSGRR